MIIIASKQERELLERLRQLDTHSEFTTYVAERGKLRDEVETLKIEKGRKVEEHEKERRELTHMIGLEKKRQEFEVAQAKREAVVTVQEANLAADKKRFEAQMDFQTKRFETEVGYLKEMMADILKRLPNVNMDIKRVK